MAFRRVEVRIIRASAPKISFRLIRYSFRLACSITHGRSAVLPEVNPMEVAVSIRSSRSILVRRSLLDFRLLLWSGRLIVLARYCFSDMDERV